jgi:photosystem II stability/assembly factor-like uncharacterized protein
MLGAVQFADGQSLWGAGFTPPGQAGLGDWTILRSRNGGRTWRQVRGSYSHNVATIASFATRSDGWTAVPNGVGAEPHYAFTVDGGRRWRRLPVPDYGDAIINRGGGRGAAFTHNPFTGKTTFEVTADRGLHWTTTPLPEEFWPDAAAYAGGERFVVAGCAAHETIVLATPDGGQSWARTGIPRLSPTPEETGCEAAVDGFTFRPDGRGFALVQRHSFMAGDSQGYASIWRTPDGGRSWSRVFFERYIEAVEEGAWFRGPYGLGRFTLVFEEKGEKGWVLYSPDGGETWSRATLPVPLTGCFERVDALVCAVDGPGLRVATLTL